MIKRLCKMKYPFNIMYIEIVHPLYLILHQTDTSKRTIVNQTYIT